MYQRILVPVDGSETSLSGLQEAIGVARLSGGSIRVLHVIDELSTAIRMEAVAGDNGDWLHALKEKGMAVVDRAMDLVREAGVPVDARLSDRFSQRLNDVIHAEATDWCAELIVMGTHGRRGVTRLMLGSDAEQILRSASVPVLLVRSSAAQQAVETAPVSQMVSVRSAALSIE